MILNQIYSWVAYKLTEWENPRTKTEFNDSYILKRFAFEFVNSYGSLFYVAFFRNIKYENGILGLGVDYQDSAAGDSENNMALLTIQVLAVTLIKPLPRFATTVIYPFFSSKIFNTGNKKKLDDGVKENFDEHKQNEYATFSYCFLERKKPNLQEDIQDEYMEKIIMYGYIMLFACSFSLGPLIVLIANLIDIRIDAKRILWIYRKPVGYKAQDIGMFYYIFQFINVCGIISNGFIIGFTSNWSSSFLKNELQQRLIFVCIFEHVVFFLWFLVIIVLPDVSNDVSARKKIDTKFAKPYILNAREIRLKRKDAGATQSKESSPKKKAISINDSEESNEKRIFPRDESFLNEKANVETRKRITSKFIQIKNRIYPDESESNSK